MDLVGWQKGRMELVHKGRVAYGEGPREVTVLAYFWGAADFWRVECAIRETWLKCGQMKTVIVTDGERDEVKRFAAEFECVDVQVEKGLVAGSLGSMSADCNGKLVGRFSTPYVLVVQDDGFPLRAGLGEFLGKWDFIGAPSIRDLFLPRLAARVLNHWTMNGGFSLRSRKICELAAKYYRGENVAEDIYYTGTLVRKRGAYRRAVRLPENREALKFSYDAIVKFDVKELPFGFHRASSFEELTRMFDLGLAKHSLAISAKGAE